MKAVDMTTTHKPPDSIGDCFRCCIASILELPPEEVPHVYDGEGFTDETGAIGKQRLLEWLAPRGLFFFEVEFEVEHLKNWREAMACHHTMSGYSPRGHRHAVVGFGGEVVHDPHPSRDGITPENGKWLLGFICKL